MPCIIGGHVTGAKSKQLRLRLVSSAPPPHIIGGRAHPIISVHAAHHRRTRLLSSADTPNIIGGPLSVLKLSEAAERS